MHLNNYAKLRKLAEKIVKEAGNVLLQSRNNVQVVVKKDIQDILTTADLSSEKIIIDSILKKFPDHSIISEEAGYIKNKNEFVWIIDPLDGTKEYFRNIPLWNCSLCLMHEGNAVMSVVYRPQEEVLYCASLGDGSFRNNVPIHVSNKKSLTESICFCYIPSYKRERDKYEWAFSKLSEIGKKVYRLRSSSDINTSMCWVAQGGCEAYLNLSNPEKIHDIAPGLFIAKEAGAFNAINKTPLIVTCNKSIYNQIDKIIST